MSVETPGADAVFLDELATLSRRFGADPAFSRAGGGNSSVKLDGVLYIKPSGVALADLSAGTFMALDLRPLLALLEASGDAVADKADSGLPGGATERALQVVSEEAAGAASDDVMTVSRSARLDPDDARYPSVEALFHALLPERFVLHTHPILVNAIGCSSDGESLATRWLGEEVVWVPYTDPGLPLAGVIRARRDAYLRRTGGRAPKAFILQNHGLIVAAETTDEIETVCQWVVGTIRAAAEGLVGSAALGVAIAGPSSPPVDAESAESLDQAAARSVAARSAAGAGPESDRAGSGVAPAGATSGAAFTGSDPTPMTVARDQINAIGPALRALLATDAHLKVVTFDDSPFALELASSQTGRALAVGGALTPDQIVYSGSWPALVPSPPDDLGATVPWLRDELARHGKSHGGPPTIVVVGGLGVFAVGSSYRQADTARNIFLDSMRVASVAHRLGGVRPLAAPEREFIERWEAEEYRRRVSAGAALSGRAAGLVAIVTGAAQGFGLAIAEDLVSQGAHVVLADVNVALASERAAELTAHFGSGAAVAIRLNVTDESSVGDCFHAAVRRFGGLDLVVSNAGVLRAGSVTRQPLAEFDAVTSVNYRGYFLCVRHAAPILARQHEAKPDYWSDIVEINSKSGLAGSSRNSAYSGSKFGGIGLTQSFALELVGDGIKVNAICPGNFLDGPLWSDPANGLFVQYLREGKVPGAKTVEDVRRFYEAKVPMGRGCTPADVLEALYYVVAQQYETGQALPVTGGQVMLS